MDEAKALSIVSALANGVNPLTGEVFAPDSPYQAADIVRALFLAARALQAPARPKARTGLPSNTGKPWTEEEDCKLLTEFDRGRPAQELAQAHSRTLAGIQARLEKHGRIPPSPEGGNSRYRRGQSHISDRSAPVR
jgi:hypothetical protein